MGYIGQGLVQAVQLIFAGDPETFAAVLVTLKVSSLSIVISLLFGLPGGFLLGYFTFPGQRLLRSLVDTLLALPTVVVGLLVYALISYRGPLGSYGLLFTIPGMALAQVILVLPIVISLSATAVASLEKDVKLNLVSLGARGWRLAWGCISEARYAIMAAVVTASGRAISEVGISMMIGGNIKWHTRTITTAIALETGKGQFSMGIALGLILLLLGFSLNAALVFLRRRSH